MQDMWPQRCPGQALTLTLDWLCAGYVASMVSWGALTAGLVLELGQYTPQRSWLLRFSLCFIFTGQLAKLRQALFPTVSLSRVQCRVEEGMGRTCGPACSCSPMRPHGIQAVWICWLLRSSMCFIVPVPLAKLRPAHLTTPPLSWAACRTAGVNQVRVCQQTGVATAGPDRL